MALPPVHPVHQQRRRRSSLRRPAHVEVEGAVDRGAVAAARASRLSVLFVAPAARSVVGHAARQQALVGGGAENDARARPGGAADLASTAPSGRRRSSSPARRAAHSDRSSPLGQPQTSRSANAAYSAPDPIGCAHGLEIAPPADRAAAPALGRARSSGRTPARRSNCRRRESRRRAARRAALSTAPMPSGRVGGQRLILRRRDAEAVERGRLLHRPADKRLLENRREALFVQRSLLLERSRLEDGRRSRARAGGRAHGLRRGNGQAGRGGRNCGRRRRCDGDRRRGARPNRRASQDQAAGAANRCMP